MTKENSPYTTNLKNFSFQQELINKILVSGAKSIDQQEFLDEAIEVVLSASFTKILPKGGIFLYNSKELELVSQIGLHKELLTICARVPLGKCLCGMAAETKQVQYANCVDHRHENSYNGMKPHGHYNIPILNGDSLMGVLVIYLPESHPRIKEEEDFLIAVSNAIGLILSRFNYVKELRDKNNELEQFAHVVSHDLKSPLIGISSLASFIEEDLEKGAKDDVYSHLNALKQCIYRMEELIEGILDYSKIGMVELQDEEIDLNDIIINIFATLKVEGAKLKFNTKLPIIREIKIYFMQLFSNLISNSIKHNDKYEKLIIIDYNDRNENHEFSVQDNGPGIPEDYHKKIFMMFETLNLKNSYENTGIGLPIVKKIIDKLNGAIKIESSENKGSKFIITIPKA